MKAHTVAKAYLRPWAKKALFPTKNSHCVWALKLNKNESKAKRKDISKCSVQEDYYSLSAMQKYPAFGWDFANDIRKLALPEIFVAYLENLLEVCENGDAEAFSTILEKTYAKIEKDYALFIRDEEISKGLDETQKAILAMFTGLQFFKTQKMQSLLAHHVKKKFKAQTGQEEVVSLYAKIKAFLYSLEWSVLLLKREPKFIRNNTPQHFLASTEFGCARGFFKNFKNEADFFFPINPREAFYYPPQNGKCAFKRNEEISSISKMTRINHRLIQQAKEIYGCTKEEILFARDFLFKKRSLLKGMFHLHLYASSNFLKWPTNLKVPDWLVPEIYLEPMPA